MPSIYANILATIRANPGLTPSEIAAKVSPGGIDQTVVDNTITQLKAEGLVAQTGETYSTATFAVTSQVA
jgi:DNA-binding transcriptional regulator LsrR (DeoR family)